MGEFLKLLPVILGLISQGPQVSEVFGTIAKLIGQIKDILPHHEAQKLDVKWLQTTLKGLGFDPGAVDGTYGDATKKAVSAYQTARGLVVDGWAGVNTTAALLAETK